MTPDRFRTIVAGVLIAGVTVAAVLIAAGFVTSLLVGWQGSLTGAATATDAATAFADMGGNLLAVRPIGLAQLGLVALLATPVLRVAASVLAFSLEGDRLYALITAVVLTVLLVSIFLLH